MSNSHPKDSLTKDSLTAGASLPETRVHPAQATASSDVARGRAAPVAEATIREQFPSAWPVLPVTIQGKPLVAILDLGTIDNYFTSAQQFEDAPIGAVTLGTSTQTTVSVSAHDGLFAPADPGHGLPAIAALFGAALLSHYDFVFDGPAGRVQLYEKQHLHIATAAARQAAWFPEGITPADCLPMEDVAAMDMRVFFPVHVNGVLMHGMFDSGSKTSNLNLAAARVLGLAPPNARVHLLPDDSAPQFSLGDHADTRVWEATGVSIRVGTKTLGSQSVLIFPHLPRETEPNDPEFSLGLDAIRDRTVYLSYSSGTFCIGAAR